MAEKTLNIYQRLHAVMEEVDYIQKEKKTGMQYSTVSHDAVTRKVRPSLVKHRVAYHPVEITRVQDGNKTMVDLVLRFVNIDSPEDFIDVPSIGDGIDNQDKGPGKAISYAVKYALLKALGLETGDDPDNHQDVTHEPGKPSDPVTLSEAQERTIKGLLGPKLTMFENAKGKVSEMSKFQATKLITALKAKEEADGVQPHPADDTPAPIDLNELPF